MQRPPVGRATDYMSANGSMGSGISYDHESTAMYIFWLVCREIRLILSNT